MASLLDLPSELLISIGAFLGHPPDILRFTRVNRRLHQLSNLLLYKMIALNSSTYRPSLQGARERGQASPFHGIRYLSLTLAARPDLGPLVRCLNLRLPCNIMVDGFGLADLLPYMPCLAELYVAIDEWKGRWLLPPTYNISPRISATTLKHVDSSLRRCSLFSQGELYTFGSLDSFSALAFLDIQYTFFLRCFFGTGHESMVLCLPKNLQELKVRCYPDYSLGHLLRGLLFKQRGIPNRQITALLLDLLEQGPPSLHKLSKLCFCFDKTWEDFPNKDPMQLYARFKSVLPKIAEDARSHGTDLTFELVRGSTLRTPQGSMLQEHRGIPISWDAQDETLEDDF